jgi:ABC-type branched-subunit amino acid transport system ATPase component/ABC-type branched-subunit amino acid transport system permease subunit
LLVILVFAPLLALLLDKVVFRKLSGANDFVKLIVTIGLLIALPALMQFIIDTLVNTLHVGSLITSNNVAQISLPGGLGPASPHTWNLFGTGAPFSSNQLVVLIVACVAAVGIWLLVQHTKVGLQMRAVVDRPGLAGMRGVSSTQMSLVATMTGTVLAAVTGIAAAPILGAINQTAFENLVFVGVAAAVLGGLRSIPLAFLGGLLLGLVQNFAVTYLTFFSSIHGFYDGVPFLVLLVVLLLVGKNRGRVAGWSAEWRAPVEYLSKMPRWRRSMPWAIASAFLVVFVLFLADHFWENLVAEGLALGLIFLSFAVVVGLGGMVSLAQAAFVSMGGLIAGLLVTHYHWPFFPALLGAVAISLVLGVLVALPALRLGGLYLALATLSLGLLADNVLSQWPWLSNNTYGWNLGFPKVGPINLSAVTDARPITILLLILVGVTVLLVRNLQRSTTGRRIDAVRSSEVAAATAGVSPVRSKLVIFVLSAAIAAVGGVFYAGLQGSASTTSATTGAGLLWLAAVVFFGVRRPGPLILAGILVTVFPSILSNGIHVYWWRPILWFGWNGTSSLQIPSILFGLGAVGLANSQDGVASQFGLVGYKLWAKRAARRGELASTRDVVADVTAAEMAEIESEVVQHRDNLRSVAKEEMHLNGRIAPNRISKIAVSIRGLHAGYGEVEILHGIDLSLRRGEILCLFGANGSGKSTFAGAIAGIVGVTKGAIEYQGKDISTLAPHTRSRRGIAIAPESRGIFPGLTIEENLALTLPEKDQREKAMDRFPILRERCRSVAGNLSGGEQQMLTLAPFLAHPPEVLIADEPTLGLAPLVVAEIMTVFSDLRSQGVAVLLIEERTSSVMPIADSVAVLELGHIVWQGPREQIDERFLAEAYLGAATEPAIDENALRRQATSPL